MRASLTQAMRSERSLSWLAAIAVALLSWLAVEYDRQPVIDESTLVGAATPPRGSYLTGITIQWSAYRKRECPARVTWEIIDSAGWAHRDLSTNGQYFYSRKTGWDHWSSQRTIHPRSAWGPARYRSTIEYLCGWTRYFVPFAIKSPEVHFMIEKPPE